MRYFFDTDNSSHWYCVDASQREAWYAWRDLDEEDPAGWEPPEFARRLEMHVSQYTFLQLEEAE